MSILEGVLADQNPWWRTGSARSLVEPLARRDFQRRLADHARTEGRRGLVVLGPRQVGKTVALRQVASDLLDEGWPPANLTYFDFSDDRLVEEISPREVASIEPPALVRGKPRALLLDEINRAQRWQDWLKQVVDSHSELRVIATGSIAGALRKGSLESGQGRWDELRVGGLTFGEHVRLRAAVARSSEGELLRRDPNALDSYLQLGGFPEHLLETDFARARARIRADIADRAIARDLASAGVDVEGVRRLFVYLASQSGGIFGSRERARDLSVDERSVKSWIEHLLDAQLIARLEQHDKGSKRLRTKPKIYAVDHGMVSAFAACPDRRQDPEIFARIVETTVFRHLRDAFDDPTERIRYFRSDLDLEGDFVVKTQHEPIVIEVTSSAVVKPEKVRRLREIGEALGTTALVLVYLGIASDTRDGVRRVPLEEFLLRPEQIGA